MTKKIPADALVMLERMEKLCGKCHRGQFRKGSGLPYKYHLYEVTKRVAGSTSGYGRGTTRTTTS